MRSGITRRWLRGNLLLTVLLLVLVEGMFLYSYTRSYYNGVQQTMVHHGTAQDVYGRHGPESFCQPQCGSPPDGGAVFR